MNIQFTAESAVALLGCHHQPNGDPERRLVEALRHARARNTIEENEQLDAALWARRYAPQFQAEQERQLSH